MIRLLAAHPFVALVSVTSRTFAGQPLWAAHPHLRGQIDLVFSTDADLDLDTLDAVLIAAEHGQSARAVVSLLDRGFEGTVVDLSADFRFADPSVYQTWFGFEHPVPALLGSFQYGLPEVYAPYAPGTRYIANPGCFATGLSLALWPLTQHLPSLYAAVTALTGASGSGTKPSAATHFPTRDGNVRGYKVLAHQHVPEVAQILGASAEIAFVPVSGPWTRGIWGTAHVVLPEGVAAGDVTGWFDAAYAEAPFVRMWPGALPELRYTAETPFCDLGWVVKGPALVVGFALDNLLKGAASQAVHNLNLLLDLPETAGLLPSTIPASASL